jgi:hypothetical protein
VAKPVADVAIQRSTSASAFLWRESACRPVEWVSPSGRGRAASVTVASLISVPGHAHSLTSQKCGSHEKKMTNAHNDSEYPLVPISFERSVLEGEDVSSFDKDRTRERSPVRYFVAAFVVGAALLVIVKKTHFQPEWLHSLAEALAEAFAVGGAIGGLLELLAAEHLIQTASDEISVKVMGHHLPGGFTDRIREIVHGTNVVLEDWCAQYAIRPDGDNDVVVTLDQFFVARNYATTKQPYRTVNAEEGVYTPTFLLLDVIHKGDKVPSEIAPTTRPTGVVEVSGPEVTLSPKGKDGDSCTVHWRMSLRMPRRYSHILAFGSPTLNPVIQCADSPGFELRAVRDDLIEETDTVWKYHRAYLPGQHLRVWW